MQVFRPISNNDLIVGAVGVLQFDVVVARLKSEYNVEAVYESVNVATARWVECADAKKFSKSSSVRTKANWRLMAAITSLTSLQHGQPAPGAGTLSGRSDSRPASINSCLQGAVAAAPCQFPFLISRLRNVLKTFTFAYVLADIPSGFKIVIYI